MVAKVVDVELQAVFKRFGSFVAVDGIDLTVERGHFVTLLGPSGCGKTTTLRMIGGLEYPDSGNILVAGQHLSADLGAARPTRMVFQNYALFPHMTVAENVAFGLRMQKLPKADITTRVKEIIALLGLTDHIAKYPRQMSGGQQQRVALARALVTRPRVLLLDEPLGALDLKMRKHMQNELKKLQREVGITFVYVTHDQAEAMFLSDAIVVMDQGRIVQQGTPADIYRYPQTAYVADFIGEANILPGEFGMRQGDEGSVTTALGAMRGSIAAGFQPQAQQRVLLSIRPEHVLLGAAVGGADFAASGKVVDLAYLGGVSRVGIAMNGLTLHADCPGLFQGAEGDTVNFGWKAADLRLLAHDDRFGDGKGAA